MEASEIAISISIFSVITATLSLGWNIYRDIILKSRVKVSARIMAVVIEDCKEHPEYLIVSAINHGPVKINLKSINMKNTSLIRWLTKKQEYAFVIYKPENNMGSQLSVRDKTFEG